MLSYTVCHKQEGQGWRVHSQRYQGDWDQPDHNRDAIQVGQGRLGKASEGPDTLFCSSALLSYIQNQNKYFAEDLMRWCMYKS